MLEINTFDRKAVKQAMFDRQDELTGYPSIDKPWLKYYSKEAIGGKLPECSIYEYMYENNKDYPRDTALNYYGRKISYAELFANINKTAAAFKSIGVKEGEIVTVALPSIPEALYVVYALNKIGAVANMIHLLASKNEIIRYLNEVESRVAVIFDKTMEILGNDIAKTSVKQAIVVTAGCSLPFGMKQLFILKSKLPALRGVYGKWEDFIKNGRNTELKSFKKDCHTMAIISHTGGTTGEPKGCVITDYNINSEIWQIGMSMPHGRQEVMMTQLPPFVNYNLVNGMLEPLAFGFTDVLIPLYEPLKFAEYVSKYQVNHINSIPAYCEAILKIPDIEKYDLSSLNYMFYGGEGMTEEIEIKINDVLLKCGVKRKLQKGMGMTEATSATSVTYDFVNNYESVGIPFSKNICKTIDVDTGKENRYGEEGEICITGPTVMKEYYNDKSATDDLIRTHEDGLRWIHTGDLGYINNNGVIFVTGRIKRIIMTKGNDGQITKMFPDRIEKAICTITAVELCCVVGMPHETRINYPKAFIVLKDGSAKNEDIKQSILNGCKELLPDYMIPEEIEFRTDLPRTSRGKVDYRALEQEIDNKTP